MAIEMLVVNHTVTKLYRFFSYLAMLGCLSPLLACSLWGGANEEEVVHQKPTYTLRQGITLANPFPLPSLTPIYVDKTRADGETVSQLAFRAWDFNQDKRFDLVEVLDSQGRLATKLYDLDFDGVVDFQRQGGAARE